MKLPWIALLSVGTAAFCQSPAQRPIDPDKLFQMPDKFAQPAPDLDRLRPQPFQWNKLIPGHSPILTPQPEWRNPQIDPKIIIHPPWHGQSKGQNVAHHLYPNLKFLPLQRAARSPR
jgi:hypothetical protein